MKKQLVFGKAGEYLADVTDMLLLWPRKQVSGTIIMMIRRQQKGYSFADFLWLPENRGTEVESSGLLHPRPCVQRHCMYGLVLGLQDTLQLSPKGFVGQILLCNWRNQRLQRVARHYKHSKAGTGWGHFQWSFMAFMVRTPMFTD